MPQPKRHVTSSGWLRFAKIRELRDANASLGTKALPDKLLVDTLQGSD